MMSNFLLSLFFIFIPWLSFASEENLPCKKVVLSLLNQTPTEPNYHPLLTQTNLQETFSPISHPPLVNSKPQTTLSQKNSSPSTKPPQRKSKFIPFLEAQKFVQSIGVKSKQHYRLLKKEGLIPNNMPANPNQVYANKGWINWKDFLGTEFLPFAEVQKFARSIGVKSQPHYFQLKREGLIPDDMPWNPDRTYEDKGWTTWGDFTGSGNVSHKSKKLLSFKDARKIVQSMKIESKEEYLQLRADGLLPDGMPSNPSQAYANKGWTTWGDFHGRGNVASKNKKFVSFRNAQKLVQLMKIKSSLQYRQMKKEGLLPDDMHSNPAKFYKNKGWINWKDFLGTTKKMKYKQAKRYAIHEAKINTVEEFIEWLKSDELPLNFPPNPAEFYEEWTSAKDFLDLNNQKEMMTHLEFKKFVQKLSFKTKRDFIKWINSEDRLEFIPPHPEKFYQKEWEGWDTYLIPLQKNFSQEIQHMH